MKDSKICLIGYGYWGKILHKNILNLGLGEVKIVDEVLGNMDEINDTYDYYFVVKAGLPSPHGAIGTKRASGSGGFPRRMDRRVFLAILASISLTTQPSWPAAPQPA